MPKASRKPPDKDRTSAPPWMVTYGDMVTQLLCFFVMLVAVSKIDVSRVQAVLDALTWRFGRHPEERNPNLILRGLEEDRIGAVIQRLVPGINLEYKWVSKGLVFVIGGKALFEPGTANLNQAAVPIIEKLAAEVLHGIINKIEIRGHASTEPVRDERFHDHWDLAYARAKRVMEVVIGSRERPYVRPEQIRPTSAGTAEPEGPNFTPEQRARNDRVEIIVLEETIKLE